MNKPDDTYIGALLEQIRDQNKVVLEAMGDMQRHIAVLPAMQQDITELKQDMKVVKAVVTDLSDQVHDHERRIGDLASAR